MKLKLFILTGILILLIGNFVRSEGKSELLGVLDFSENGANKLVVEGHEINLLEKGSKVQVVKEEDGSITINLIGKGSIKFDGSQTPLNNIANAKVKLKEEEIKYAEFDSVEGGLYFFRKGEEEIRISANKGGKVVYDMDKNEIGGENVWVSYKQNEIKGKGNTKVFLDKEGNILYASISAGEFEDKERKLIYSSKENFEVRFDKLVEELYKGNAVSFKGDMVNMKGKVNVYNEEFGISYEGIGENVVAEYNPIFQNFDIHNGDALISNGKHEVLFDNGKIKLSGALKDIGKAETFGFRYVKDEDTPDKYLRINEEFERFDMVAFNEDKKGMFIIENLGDFEKNALANYESQSTNLFDSAISLEKQGFKSEAIEIYKQIFNSYSEGSEERRYALEMYLRATKGEEIQEVDFAKGGFSNSGGYGFEYDSENGIIKLEEKEASLGEVYAGELLASVAGAVETISKPFVYITDKTDAFLKSIPVNRKVDRDTLGQLNKELRLGIDENELDTLAVLSENGKYKEFKQRVQNYGDKLQKEYLIDKYIGDIAVAQQSSASQKPLLEDNAKFAVILQEAKERQSKASGYYEKMENYEKFNEPILEVDEAIKKQFSSSFISSSKSEKKDFLSQAALVAGIKEVDKLAIVEVLGDKAALDYFRYRAAENLGADVSIENMVLSGGRFSGVVAREYLDSVNTQIKALVEEETGLVQMSPETIQSAARIIEKKRELKAGFSEKFGGDLAGKNPEEVSKLLEYVKSVRDKSIEEARDANFMREASGYYKLNEGVEPSIENLALINRLEGVSSDYEKRILERIKTQGGLNEYVENQNLYGSWITLKETANPLIGVGIQAATFVVGPEDIVIPGAGKLVKRVSYLGKATKVSDKISDLVRESRVLQSFEEAGAKLIKKSGGVGAEFDELGDFESFIKQEALTSEQTEKAVKDGWTVVEKDGVSFVAKKKGVDVPDEIYEQVSSTRTIDFVKDEDIIRTSETVLEESAEAKAVAVSGEKRSAYTLHDSNNNPIAEVVLPSEIQSLRANVRARQLGDGSPTEISGVIAYTVETAADGTPKVVLGKMDLPKEGEILVFRNEKSDTVYSLLAFLKASDSPIKWGESPKIRKLVEEAVIQEGLDLDASFGIKKPLSELDDSDWADLHQKLSSVKIISLPKSTINLQESAVSYHTHPYILDWVDVGNDGLNSELREVIGARMYGTKDENGIVRRMKKQEFEKRIGEIKMKAPDELKKSIGGLQQDIADLELSYLAIDNPNGFIPASQPQIREMVSNPDAFSGEYLDKLAKEHDISSHRFSTDTGQPNSNKERVSKIAEEIITKNYAKDNIKLRKAEFLLESLEEGDSNSELFLAIGDSGYYKPSGLTGKFEGDARALFKNKEWVNLPNGRRIKMDVINYQGGKTTMFQIDRDPNFHVVYEFGFGRVEQTIPIVHP